MSLFSFFNQGFSNQKNFQLQTYQQTLSQFLSALPTANNLLFDPMASNSSLRYQPSKQLRWSDYVLIAKSNADVRACLTLWQATTGSNGWDVYCNLFDDSSFGYAINKIKSRQNINHVSEQNNGGLIPITDFNSNLEMAKSVYDTLKNLIDIDGLRQKIVYNLAVFGNCFVYIEPNTNLPMVVGSDKVNVYFNSNQTKIDKIRLLNQNGVEVSIFDMDKKPKTKNNLANRDKSELDLIPGVDIFHLKDFGTGLMASPRLDACYEQILTQLHIWQSSNQKFSRGLIDLTFLVPEKESMPFFQSLSKDGKTTNAQEFVATLKDFFGGAKNAGSTAVLPGIKEIKELGKNNRDMQTLELEARTTETIAKAFSLTPTDLGVGDNTTYNNASVFSYSAYRKIGKPIEEQMERLVNNFILPKLGLSTGKDLYFYFNPASNPDSIAREQFALSVFEKSVQAYIDYPELKNRLFNEMRDKLGLEDIDFK